MKALLRFVAIAAPAITLLPTPARATQDTTPETRDLAPLLQPIRERYRLIGLAGAILSEGRVVAIGATGVRKKGDETPLTTDDVFHLGSCTKAMTATMIATLVEEGKLSWDTIVADFFTETVPKIHEGWRDVTLAHLLVHRGGAPGHLEIDDLWWRLQRHEGTPVEARRDLVLGVLAIAPRARPGEEYIYSNAGYAIAGAMAEQVTETPYEELMQKRLFEPLGMSSAGFGAPGTAGEVDQPWGHAPDGHPFEPGPTADNPPAIAPAGRVHATLRDWAQFVALHVAGARGESPLLKAGTFEKLQTPPDVKGADYAMGWFNVPRAWAGGKALNHAGSNTKWYAVVWAAPERDFAVLVTCNQAGRQVEKACENAVQALIQAAVSARADREK